MGNDRDGTRVRLRAVSPADAGFDDLSFHVVQMEAVGGGQLVGSIATHPCDAGAGTLGYGLHLSEEHRGHRYAREANCPVLRCCFQELRFQ